jgi:hypothetical protein
VARLIAESIRSPLVFVLLVAQTRDKGPLLLVQMEGASAMPEAETDTPKLLDESWNECRPAEDLHALWNPNVNALRSASVYTDPSEPSDADVISRYRRVGMDSYRMLDPSCSCDIM